MRQTTFHFHKSRLTHGGSLARGRRKLARPIDPKRPLHLVMRAKPGTRSLLGKERQVRATIERMAKRFRIRIHEYANAGNHLHLLVRGPNRKQIQDFLRSAAGLVARLMTGAEKGRKTGTFWEALVFSRVVAWGRAFRVAKDYVALNFFETRGVLFRSDRGKPPPRIRSSRLM